MLSLLRHLADKAAGRIPLDAPRRSSQWPKVERAFLVENPCCKVCDSRKYLNVHHIFPYHLFPEKELITTNLITLCRAHHELFGHLDDWKAYNPTVQEDSELWNKKIKERKYD